MTNIERVKSKKLFYKMGVMCGELLYYTYKFDDFEKMVQKAKEISEKYKDMQYCTFVIQAFKDDSYDFEKSCFFQTELFVYDIKTKIDSIAEKILQDSEENEEAGTDNGE